MCSPTTIEYLLLYEQLIFVFIHLTLEFLTQLPASNNKSISIYLKCSYFVIM